MLRRLFIFLMLVVVLAGTYFFNQLTSDWHYIVPAQAGEIIYAETFDAGTDWLQDSRQLFTAEVTDGALLLALDTAGNSVFSAASPFFRDFDLNVEMRAVDGPENNAYGIVFRQTDQQNYYNFLISSNGYYRVSRVVDGMTKVLHNWHGTEHINQGIGALNRVRVIGYQDRFQFYINGEQVALCIPDDPEGESTPLIDGSCSGGAWQSTLVDDSLSQGHLGVVIEIPLNQPTGVAVEFDNVIVIGPQPIDGE